MNKYEFEEQLIKGKITELIFELMFRHAGYTVIKNGYEYTNPLLAQHHDLLKEKGVLDSLRHSPDFIIISQDNAEAYIIEVKYRSEIHHEVLKETAEELLKRWSPSHIFLATPDAFYYDPCHTIVNRDGEISKLLTSIINEEAQSKYHALLRKFIQ